MEELESQLITADVGVDATARVMASLNARVARSEVGDSEALRGALREELFELLAPVERPLEIPDADTPFVILVVGVNGAGKTTTNRQARETAPGRRQERHARRRRHVPRGRRRAAAGLGGAQRACRSSPRARGRTRPRSASTRCSRRAPAGVDVLIADTAGRLHTQSNLMDELAKVKRVIGKLDAPRPARDAARARRRHRPETRCRRSSSFHAAMDLSGLVVTKLDGTARGGIVLRHRRTHGAADPLHRRRRAGRGPRGVRGAALRRRAGLGRRAVRSAGPRRDDRLRARRARAGGRGARRSRTSRSRSRAALSRS